MTQQDIITTIAHEVRNTLEGEGSGHDWWHIVRVWNMAKRIGTQENADLFVIELSALLHDIADWKAHDGDESVGPRVAKELMTKYAVPSEVIAHACDIIANLSYKGAGVPTEMKTIEGKIVQDADRLDAIGAIGIARAFTYGGHKNRILHDPSLKPVLHQSKEAYFKSQNSTINHFYEKLLLVKDRMNTHTAKTIAIARHRFLEEYLQRFLQEWDGTL